MYYSYYYNEKLVYAINENNKNIIIPLYHQQKDICNGLPLASTTSTHLSSVKSELYVSFLTCYPKDLDQKAGLARQKTQISCKSVICLLLKIILGINFAILASNIDILPPDLCTLHYTGRMQFLRYQTSLPTTAHFKTQLHDNKYCNTTQFG